MFELYVNSVLLTNYEISTPYSDTIDEELDSFNFQIKSENRISFKKYDKIQYIIKQKDYANNYTPILSKIFALFDFVETYENEYWLYQLTLLSPTKLLENLIINGMADTYGVQEETTTLKDQANRVVEKINAQLGFENVGVTLVKSSATFNLLASKRSNNFLWSGQQTVREILQDICDKADCLILGTDFTYNNGSITSITLGVIKRELKGSLLSSGSSIEGGGLNAIKSVIKGISIHRNSEYACGSIVSLTKNAICKDSVQQTYLPARNDDMTIDDASDWHILTQEPIYSLNKVYAYISVRTYIKVWRDNGGVLEEQFYSSTGQPNSNPTPLFMLMPYDITNYIVEKDVYDALPVKEQKKRLYFKRGEKGIYGLYKRYKENPLWSSKALDNICKSMTPSIVVNSNGVLTLDYCGNPPMLMDLGGNLRNVNNDFPSVYNYPFHYSESGLKEANAVKTFDRTGLTLDDIEVEHALFSVNYQPYCDSVVKIEKDITPKGNVKNLSVLKNQSDSTIDASKYYDSQKALINRLGNEELTLDCMFDLDKKIAYNYQNKYELLFNLGDYITLDGIDWTLTKRTISNYGNNKLKCRMTFSQYFNASNSAINLNRDKRLYGIPLSQYVDRYIIIKYPNASNITKLAIESWDDFSVNQTESTANVERGHTILDLIKIGNESQIDKVARCKDNYAVDIERTKYSNTIVNINLRYCDADGYKENINLYGLSDSQYNEFNIADYSRLPFISINNVDYPITHYASSLVLNGVKKDKMERLIFIVKPNS